MGADYRDLGYQMSHLTALWPGYPRALQGTLILASRVQVFSVTNLGLSKPGPDVPICVMGISPHLTLFWGGLNQVTHCTKAWHQVSG